MSCALTPKRKVSSVDNGNEDYTYYHLKSTNLPDIDCATSDCYELIEKKLETKKIDKDEVLELNNDKPLNKKIGNQIYLIGKRSPVTVIAIHGLYGDSSQFYWETRRFLSLGFNVILLTLPGHGPDMHNHKKVKRGDWMLAVENAAKVGKQLGDKLLFYGQSTGGLLSSWYTSNNQEDVVLQYLIEPAFKVKSRLAIGTCIGKSIIPTAQSIDWMAKLFFGISSRGINQPISLNMGCEVHRMAKSVFPNISRKYKNVNNSNTSNLVFDGYEFGKSSIFDSLKVPTVIAYTKNDTIVDPKAIEAARDFTSVDIVEVSNDKDGKKVDHGYHVQSTQKGSVFFGTFHDYSNNNQDNSSKKDILISRLQENISLRSYMKNNFNYYYAKYLYEDFPHMVTNIQNSLERIKLFYTKREFIWDTDVFSPFFKSRTHFKYQVEVCELFNNKSSLCDLKKMFKDHLRRVLGQNDYDIFETIAESFSDKIQNDNLHQKVYCVSLGCRMQLKDMSIFQARNFILRALLKLNDDSRFTDWLGDAFEAKELVSWENIPRSFNFSKLSITDLDFFDE